MKQNYFSKLSNRLWVSLILTLLTTFSYAQSNQFYTIMPCIDKCGTSNPIPGYPTVLTTDDISVSGTNLNMLNDATLDIPLGNFNFNFYCQKVTSLRVGADGAIIVNGPSVNLPNRNNVPGGGANRGLASLVEYIIAPYWDELNLVPNVSSVRWERKSSPDRIIVQWDNVSVKPIGSTENTDNLTMTFRVVLFANSSDIVFFYKDTELESRSVVGPNFDIASQYQFGLDASVGLRNPCNTGRRSDKVNNVVFNNPGDGVSLLAPDPDTCRIYRAYVFQPKTNCADIFAKDSTIAPVCVGSPLIQINPSGPAINGSWKGVGTNFLSTLTLQNPKFNPTTAGTYTLMWNAGDRCAYNYNIKLKVDEKIAAVVNPVPEQCGSARFQLTAQEPRLLDGSLATGSWRIVSGSGTITPTGNTAVVNGVGTSTPTVVEWKVVNGTCESITTVTLKNRAAPVAIAGSNINQCSSNIFTMKAVGAAAGSTGMWTVLSGNATITNPSDPLTKVTITSGTTATLRWTVSYNDFASCVSFGNVIITNDDPVASAGPDRRSCKIRVFALGGTAPTGNTTGMWTVKNGNVIITDPKNPNTTVQMVTGITATLIWTVSVTGDTTCNATDEVVLFLDDPIANAGVDQNKCQLNIFNLDANVAPLGMKGSWSIVSGTAVIADFNNPKTTATLNGGSMTATLRWTVTVDANPFCTAFDDIVIINNTPQSAAGPDLRLCNERVFQLGGSNPGVLASGKWVVITGNVTLANDTLFNTKATVNTGNIAQIEWVVTSKFDPTCSTKSQITLRVDEPKANAGKDISNCQDRNFMMVANAAPLGMTGKWTLLNGDATITDVNNPLTTVKINTNTVATLRWTVSVDDNKTCFATDDIILTVIDVQSSAGPDLRQCKNRTFVLGAQAAGSGTTGVWTIVNGDVTINSPSSPNSIAILNTGTVATLKWTLNLVADPTCKATDEVILRLDEPVALAGDDIRNCQTRNFTLAANTPSVLEVGKWTIIEGNATITNDALNNTTVSVNSGASAKLRWTVSVKDNPNCTAFDEIVLFVDDAQSTAGTTIRQCKERIFVMKATAPPTGFTGKWTVKNGTVTIVNDASPTTLVRLVSGNTATLIWSVSVNANPTCNAASEVTIQVDEPVANAGNDFRLCRTRDFTMAATTTAVGTTGKWSIASGDATINNINSPTTSVTLNTGKTATLRWVVSVNDNPTCTSSDDAIITTEDPQANAGVDQRQCQNSVFTLAATAPASGSTGSWSTVSGPIRFSNITSLNSTATLTTNKSATARWTVAITGLESCRAVDEVSLIADEPVVATIDPVVNNCENSTFNLVANTPSVGTGIWSIKSGAATISDVNSPTITVTNVALESPVVLAWTVTEVGNPCGAGIANITLTNFVKNRVAFVKDTISNCISKTEIILSTLGTITGSATKNGTWKALKGNNATTIFGKFVDINGIETNIWSKAVKYLPSLQEQIRGEVVLELCTDANGVCPSECKTVVIKLASPGLTCADKLNLTPITLLYPTCKAIFDSTNIIKNKDYKYYTVKITDAAGNPLVGNMITSDYIGSFINIALTDACTTINCQINILGQTPTIECPNDVTLNCGQIAANALPPLSMTGDLGLDIYPSAFLTAKAQGAKDGSIIGCARQLNQNYDDKEYKSCSDPYSIFSTPSAATLSRDLGISLVEATAISIRINSVISANMDVFRIIVRRFTVTYGSNGETTAPCFQLIYTKGVYWDPNLIVCPKDKTVDCFGDEDLCDNITPKNINFNDAISPFYYDADNSGTFTTGDTRFSLSNIPACNIAISVKDSIQNLCKGSYNLFRSFTIEDICSNGKKRCEQKVEVMDYQQPIVIATFSTIKKVKQPFCYVNRWNENKTLDGVDIAVGYDTTSFDGYIKRKKCNVQEAGKIATVYALSNSTNCGGRVQIKFLACDPNCSNDLVRISANDSRYKLISTKKITDANGAISFEYLYEAFYEELGEYDVIFKADDDCGFASALKSFHVIVEDNAKPSFACIQSHTASITTDGTVRIEAKTFLKDYWKSDNCSVEYVFARRMDGMRCTPSVCGQKEVDTSNCFKEYIEFGCCDVGNTDTVIVRVVDGNGNYNDCMVVVKTDDKIRPVCIAPATLEIPCFETINGKRVNISDRLLNPDLWFGKIAARDNCGEPQITHTIATALDNCSVGTITRTWTVRDCKGENPTTCRQVITTKTQSDFSVDFPDDVTLSCTAAIPTIDALKKQMLDPNSWAAGKDGAIKNDGCSTILISIKDHEANSLGNCRVIYRKITVYDDCKYNPNNDLVDQSANCYGLPLCDDAHSNPNWATINEPAWANIRNLGCATTPRERRFRDADATILQGEGNPLGPLNNSANALHPYSFADGVICFIQTIKVIDETKPTPELKTEKVFCSTKQDLKCTVAFRDTLKASDECGGLKNTEGLIYTWSLFNISNQSKNGDIVLIKSGKTPFISDTLDYGTYQINWSVKDLCGNNSDLQSYKITLKDCQAPFILAHKKIAELGGVNGVGMVQVCVSDVLNNMGDDCTDSTYLDTQLTLVRASDNSNNKYPSNPQRCLMLTCSDAGKDVILQLWTRDKAGNANFVNSTISVQNNLRLCPITVIPAPGIVAQLATEKDILIKNATVSALSSGTFTQSIVSNTEGVAQILNLPINQNYDIKAEKTDEPYLGVTTFDISLISRHILDIEKIKTPYSIIAADVNGNGEVDGADLIHLRNFILRKTNALPAGAWRFVDKKYTFLNPTAPFNEDFPQIVSFRNLTENQTADFVAIKIGDVNGTYRPSSLTGSSTSLSTRSNDNWTLTTDDIDLEKGKNYTVKIKTNSLKAASFQFTLAFTEGSAQVKTVEAGNVPNLTSGNFGLFQNAITTSWNGKADISETELFSLTFTAQQSGKLSEFLRLNSQLTPAEASNTEGVVLNTQLQFTNSKVSVEKGEFALYQNRPNPTRNTTNIGFNLPKESDATLVIYNLEGKVVKTVKGSYKGGFNEISVSKSDIGAAGVFYYRLETSDFSATKKMVIVE
jgi:Dockerin type I domain